MISTATTPISRKDMAQERRAPPPELTLDGGTGMDGTWSSVLMSWPMPSSSPRGAPLDAQCTGKETRYPDDHHDAGSADPGQANADLIR